MHHSSQHYVCPQTGANGQLAARVAGRRVLGRETNTATVLYVGIWKESAIGSHVEVSPHHNYVQYIFKMYLAFCAFIDC